MDNIYVILFWKKKYYYNIKFNIWGFLEKSYMCTLNAVFTLTKCFDYKK